MWFMFWWLASISKESWKILILIWMDFLRQLQTTLNWRILKLAESFCGCLVWQFWHKVGFFPWWMNLYLEWLLARSAHSKPIAIFRLYVVYLFHFIEKNLPNNVEGKLSQTIAGEPSISSIWFRCICFKINRLQMMKQRIIFDNMSLKKWLRSMSSLENVLCSNRFPILVFPIDKNFLAVNESRCSTMKTEKHRFKMEI